MFKFLRKYNTIILAVFGSILVVVFLVPQAITQISQRLANKSASVATVGNNNTKVPLDEYAQAQQETLFMEKIGLPVGPLGIIKDPQHWYLLVREAEQAGLLGQSSAGYVPPDQLVLYAAVGQVNIAFVDRFFSRFLGVDMLISSYRNAGKFSDRRLRHEAERMFHQVQVQLVVLDASEEDSSLVPAEQALNEQFEKYADDAPGEGDMGFGYKLPDRVKLEWLTINAQGVREIVAKDSEALNGVNLRIHWQENAGQDGLPPVETGVPVPESVRNHKIDQMTEEKIDDIAKWVADQFQTARRGVPQRSGYLVIPEDWKDRQLHMDALAQLVRSRYEGLPLPAYNSTGDDWYAADELASLTSLSIATTEKFGRVMFLKDLVSATKEFDTVTTTIIQQDITAPVLRGSDGSLYFFRIIDTDPTRRPHSLDEVRQQVADDLKRLDHYEILKASLSEIEQEARANGLLSTATKYDTIVQLRSTAFLSSPYTTQIVPQATPLPVIGSNQQMTEAIINRALALPRTQNFQYLSEEQSIFAIALEDRMSIVIAKMVSQNPLTENLFGLLVSSQQVQNLIQFTELDDGKGFTEAFSYETLAARHNFIPNRAVNDDPDADESATTQTAKADSEETP